MPNKRAKGQKGVLVNMRETFLDEIDRSLPEAGYSDRSTFIRDAVYEKLVAMGFDVAAIEKTAPSRVGKGGRPKINNQNTPA